MRATAVLRPITAPGRTDMLAAAAASSPRAIARSSSRTSAGVAGRPSGVLASSWATSAARAGGTPSSAGATVVSCRVNSCVMSSSSHSGRPLQHSQRITPSAYKSTRASICPPTACSGAM